MIMFRSVISGLLSLVIASLTCAAETMAFRVEASPSIVNVDQQFLLSVYARDIRPDALGILSAYLDMVYPSSLVELDVSRFSFGPDFGTLPHSDFASPGAINEVGSLVNGLLQVPPLPTGIGSAEVLFFSVPVTAKSPGTAIFQTDMADVLPLHAITMFGRDEAVASTEVSFGAATVTIVPEPSGLILLGVAAVGLCRRRIPVI